MYCFLIKFRDLDFLDSFRFYQVVTSAGEEVDAKICVVIAIIFYALIFCRNVFSNICNVYSLTIC